MTISNHRFIRRFQLGLLTLLYALFCLYGSWVPFHFRGVGLDEAMDRFRNLPYLQIGVGRRADWVANLLLFMPLGFLGMGSLRLDIPRANWWLGFQLLAWVGLALHMRFVSSSPRLGFLREPCRKTTLPPRVSGRPVVASVGCYSDNN